MTDKTHTLIRGRKLVGNAAYLLFGQVMSMLSPALTAIFVARKMSVDDFATLSYVLALVAMATAVMTAGLSGLAIREITAQNLKSQYSASASMRSIVFLRETFACIGMIGVISISFLGGFGGDAAVLTAVAAISLLFRASDALEFWYQAHEKVASFVLLRGSILAIMIGIRIVLIYLGVNLLTIMWSIVAESLLLSVISWIYNRRSSLRVYWKSVGGSSTLDLLKMSWLLLLSGLLTQMNMRLGVVLLEHFSDKSEVARFAAASRLTEFAFVLPVVVTTASFPRLLKTRATYGPRSKQYLSEVDRSLRLAFSAGLVLCVVGVLLAPILIPIVYGDGYNSSVPVLQLTVVTLPFIFMGAVLSKWLVAENLLMLSTWRNALALVVNIVLIAIFAPKYGALGAGFAYLWSYIFANYISFFFTRRSREMASAMTYAMVYPVVFPVRRVLRSWARSRVMEERK
ncbi:MULTISPECIES: flippase [unclassified Rhodococcus (in: high G+C Gram-positive bacteria)]|uniref:flippase n=1 Tax=unclassified Rhodococcus (in: high G+C Gram-positive bacteria) TaxID=192944 RepID=UPI001444B27C|nr:MULTISPECIES: flippase [unclassified Rhodococcus (in: high G+C Gram-positive bacteria)]